MRDRKYTKDKKHRAPQGDGERRSWNKGNPMQAMRLQNRFPQGKIHKNKKGDLSKWWRT